MENLCNLFPARLLRYLSIQILKVYSSPENPLCIYSLREYLIEYYWPLSFSAAKLASCLVNLEGQNKGIKVEVCRDSSRKQPYLKFHMKEDGENGTKEQES